MKSIKNHIKKNDELAYRLKAFKIRSFGIITKIMSDKLFIKTQYLFRTKKRLNLDNPKTFNEKLQWYKLNYHNPILNKCVDKIDVREYVREKLGSAEADEILIPMIDFYDKVEDINFSVLPNEYIVKLSNGSSFNYICFNNDDINKSKIKSRFSNWIKLDYFSYGREWAYKDVKNRILIEQLLKPSSGEHPQDYRFFCFDGEVEFITVDSNSVENGVKNSNYNRNIYDKNWQLINARIQYPQNDKLDDKPDKLASMIKMAEKLSENFPQVRVDFYYFDEKIYFGELTFYHASGYQKIEPKEFDDYISSKFLIDGEHR